MTHPLAFDPGREEIFHIKGDAPDPTGGGLIGTSTSLNVGAAGKVGIAMIRYGDLILEADVYKVGQEPIEVVMFCPRCHKAVRIRQDNKPIDWTPPAPGFEKMGGAISIGAFECPWELGDQKELGAELCRQKLVVEHNVARVP